MKKCFLDVKCHPSLIRNNVFVMDATGVNIEEQADYCEQNATCWAEGAGYSIETWWSKVRRTDGREGWVKDPIRNLDGVLRSD